MIGVLVSLSRQTSIWLPVVATVLSAGLGLVDLGTTDVLLVASCLAIQRWDHFLSIATPFLFYWLRVHALAAAIFSVWLISWTWHRETRLRPPLPGSHNDQWMRPLLFPSKTTHTRFFPKRHSFEYSYLSAGIPVGWTGAAGSLLSVHHDPVPKSVWYRLLTAGLYGHRDGGCWFSVDPADYLERGDGKLGLDGKLRKYLKSQGIDDPDEYPYAYIVTAPKFLGYSFNPVSFWYLYSADKILTAMVLEVNNTFDERRMYLLKRETSTPESLEDSNSPPELPDDTKISGDDNRPPTTSQATRFTNTWPKDFHVSPFNSRKGTYSLIATDPLSTTSRGPDNTITLLSSKSHPKLVARIFPISTPVDPAKLSLFQRLLFIAKWWWVGLVTFPRIVREAGKLYFKRKLHVWFRPEPLDTNISRHATVDEARLEAHFRAYLAHLVAESPEPLTVIYAPAGITTAPDPTKFTSPSAIENAESKTLNIKVQTPIFYARFIHYKGHDLETFLSESQINNTLSIQPPSLLHTIKFPAPVEVRSKNYITHILFSLINSLRRPPPKIIQHNPGKASDASSRDTNAKSDMQIPEPGHGPNGKEEGEKGNDKMKGKVEEMEDATRDDVLSPMDFWALAQEDEGKRTDYAKLVLKVLVSGWVAGGETGILDTEMFLLRLCAAWVVAGLLGSLSLGNVYELREFVKIRR